MNTKTEAAGSPLDTAKLVLAVVFLVAGISAYYFFSDQPGYIRVLMILLSVVLALLSAWFTVPGKALWAFFQESKTEVRKVVWPTRTETVHTTLIVLIMVLLAASALWLLDTLFAAGFSLLLGQGS
jgi:preprotein translocase subunit SecE